MGKNKHLRKRQFSAEMEETNNRFWAQSGYKPGAQLNMSDPSDKAMAQVWNDVHAYVLTEVRDGKMVRTFDDPRVVDHLDNGKKAYLAAINHMIGAQQATDDAHLQAHLAAAKEANQIARDSCAAAAALQPPSVTPSIIEQARAEVAATAPIEPAQVPAITGAEAAEQPVPTEQPQSNPAPDPAMLAPENDPWDAQYKPPMQADNPPAAGPVMPGDPGWVDYADAKPAPQRPHAELAPKDPPMLAPKNDPWDERYEPPKPAEQAPEPAPAPAPGKGPPPGWKSPPEWKDFTGEKPSRDPGAPKLPPQRKQSGRGRTSTPSGGPSAGQVLVGVGVTAAFFGVAALFRRAWR